AERRIAVPAVQYGAGIDRDQVTGTQSSLARYPVHDLLVHRDADQTGETVVTEEVRVCSRMLQGPAGSSVQIPCRSPGPDRTSHLVVDLGDDQARLAHGPDLPAGLVLDPAEHSAPGHAQCREQPGSDLVHVAHAIHAHEQATV